MTLRLGLTLGVILLLAVVQAQSDPCVLPPNVGNAYVGKPEALRDCFTQVPFQQAQAKDTIVSLRSLVDMYSFTDKVANSGEPWNMKVNLRASLDSISNKVNSNSYSNDYAFQVDLMNTFNPLFDAHTLYMAPRGYQCFVIRPFNIEASVDSSGKNMVYTLRQGPLAATTASVWRQVFNEDIAQYENQVVTKINGMSVTDHVLKVAQHFVSTYKDNGVRYNAALRGRWAQTVLSMFPLTDSNMDLTMTLTLASGKQVTFTNAAFCSGGIASTSALLSKNKAALLDSLNADQLIDLADAFERERVLVRGIDINKEWLEMFDEALASAGLERESPASVPLSQMNRPTSIRARDLRTAKHVLGNQLRDLSGLAIPTRTLPATFDASDLHIIQSSYSMDTVFMIYNNTQHPTHYILRLTSFAPADERATINVIQSMIQMAQRNNIKHLIVDVANNGGGIICLSDLLLAILVPDWVSLQPGVQKGDTLPYGIYDFRQSPTTDAIRSNRQLGDLFMGRHEYIDLITKKVYTNDSVFDPISRTRGGLTSRYTQQAYFPAECENYPSGFTPIKYYFPYISILTDGTCGSACSLFASQMSNFKYARVVSFAGPLNSPSPIDTSSFAGGNVYEYDTIATYSWYYGNGDKRLPQRMSSTARARFNFNEYYLHDNLDTPREFLKMPADIHLDYYATLYNSDLKTDAGKANSAALYAAVASI